MGSEIPSQLVKYIAVRDARIMKTQPWSTYPLRMAFDELLTRGVVRMGGRASCGGKVDPTWQEFGWFNEIIRKAVALGYRITVTPIKQPNKSPTMAGGFWDENEYSLVNQDQTP